MTTAKRIDYLFEKQKKILSNRQNTSDSFPYRNAKKIKRMCHSP